tara:strand:+ start:878 stop:1258 length:381 start_codon:yes stop_codon:yes gene_type:complete
MVTKEYSSAPKAENNPMKKFETILQSGNKCLNNVAQSNQSVKRTVEDTARKFFASHDHLKKEVKDEFLRFTGVLVVELEASRKKDEERDQKVQAIYEMTEKMSDLIFARLSYPLPKEGEYLEEIDD